jgi:hypothetical protein
VYARVHMQPVVPATGESNSIDVGGGFVYSVHYMFQLNLIGGVIGIQKFRSVFTH